MKKALYGLAQSPRAWNQKVNSIMETFGFDQLHSDASVFVTNWKGSKIIMAVFVDDCLILGDNEQHIKEFELQLSKRYNIKILGELKKIIGMNWVRDRKSRRSFLHQTGYCEKVLERFGMKDCKASSTPADPESGAESELLESNQKYMEAAGALIYLSTQTRPDISYAVSKISEKMQRPTVADWTAAKKIFRYLNGTKDYGIVYQGSTEKIEAYADADYGGDRKERKSRSGMVVKAGYGTVCWGSKKQKIVAMSTVEAEYVATASTSQEITWVEQLLKELGKRVETPRLWMDNQGALAISKDPSHHNMTKHIEIRYHYLRQRVKGGKLRTEYCPTQEMIADIMTKALSKGIFERLREKLGLTSLSNFQGSVKSPGVIGDRNSLSKDGNASRKTRTNREIRTQRPGKDETGARSKVKQDEAKPGRVRQGEGK